MFELIVKIGGSLHDAPTLRQLLGVLAEAASTRRLLVVPGGGPFADLVRAVDRRWRLSPTAAHWMAILGMDQYAWWLADLVSSAQVVTDPESAGVALASRKLPILAPSTWLRLADPLPHTWSVTSDSIAAWVAGQTGAQLLVLCKAIDGLVRGGRLLPVVHPQELGAFDAVDPMFGSLLPEGCEAWIVNGCKPTRLAALLGGGQVRGTRITRSR